MFVATTTLTAGVRSVLEIYLPMSQVDATRTLGSINTVVTTTLLVCVVAILSLSAWRWAQLLRERRGRSLG